MTEKETEKTYSNGEVTIVWQPTMCMHSTVCWKNATGLPEVFDPRKRPWIDPLGATSSQIIEQVDKCPSGALSYFLNNEGPKSATNDAEVIVEINAKGPLMVYGKINIIDQNGNITERNKSTAFCRCGASANKPYCDGSHSRIDFNE